MWLSSVSQTSVHKASAPLFAVCALFLFSLAAPPLTSARDDHKSPTAPRDAQEPAVAEGPALTTNQGLKVDDDDNSLKAGPRGPVLDGGFSLSGKDHPFRS